MHECVGPSCDRMMIPVCTNLYLILLHRLIQVHLFIPWKRFGSSFQHYRRLEDIERKQCQDKQLYKVSSTESQKGSPEPEIFRTTKNMRSDKVLFPKSQTNSSTYDTVKAYTVITVIRKYISTNGCIFSQHTKPKSA